jgi:hypothetical protein
VFRSSSVEPVWEVQNQSILSHPLALAVGDICVDDHLSRVEKVAELGLPDHKIVGVVEGESVFVGHGSILGQWTVVDFDLASARLLLGEELECVEGIFCFLVNQTDVPLREGSSFDILPSEADIVPFVVETEQCEGLAGRPVQIVVLYASDSVIDLILLDSGVDREVRGVEH